MLSLCLDCLLQDWHYIDFDNFGQQIKSFVVQTQKFNRFIFISFCFCQNTDEENVLSLNWQVCIKEEYIKCSEESRNWTS